MFRKNIDGNISNEEFEQFHLPFILKCNKFLEHYIIPEYIAFYIGIGFYENSLWESSFSQHFNSAADMFNLIFDDKEKVMEITKQILEIKYSLKVVQEQPTLLLEKI